ncbi:MAG: hypothetical protein NPIRA06_31800 [Nitrospirales bacterium]|nr:MAG: hypothetical protein NPIRA06_31800 [Nitrospirales bacterium]
MDWYSRHMHLLLAKKIQVGMDGLGRVFNNIFIEQLWRKVKYEKIYLSNFQSVQKTYADQGLF